MIHRALALLQLLAGTLLAQAFPDRNKHFPAAATIKIQTIEVIKKGLVRLKIHSAYSLRREDILNSLALL